MKNKYDLILTTFRSKFVYVNIWEEGSVIFQGKTFRNQFLTILKLFNNLKIKRDTIFKINLFFIELAFSKIKTPPYSSLLLSFPIFFHSFMMPNYKLSITKIVEGYSDFECIGSTFDENIYSPYIKIALDDEKKEQ